MSPKRVFRGNPDRPTQIYRVILTHDIQEDELAIFLQETQKVLPKSSYHLFERLVKLPPARRLAVSLKCLLDIMAKRTVSDTMREGLTDSERDALIDLQVKNMTPRIREIGHGLLCIDERFEFIEVMGPHFTKLVTKKGGFIHDG